MSHISKLPEALTEKITEASVKIGPERAFIALQGLVHISKPLRIIDGVLRDETVQAVNETVRISGIDNLVAAYMERLDSRFPGIFDEEEADDEGIEEKAPDEEDVPKRTRRTK